MHESATGIEINHRQKANVKGKKFFHSRYISWSYRNRGYEARTHRNINVSSAVLITNDSVFRWVKLWLIDEPRNRMVVMAFIAIMLAYSARKNMANGPAAYSTLKPDTNSDSPSVKSNGARLVSARVEMYHIMVRGHVVMISHMFSCVMIKFFRVKEPLISIIDNKMMARVTSYEIV